MRETKRLIIMFIACLLVSLILPMFASNVYATEKNEVTLNFEGGIIHDGYVEYSEVGKLQLLKDDAVVTEITNDMKIDLNEAEYAFLAKANASGVTSSLIRLVINGKAVVLNIDNIYKLDSSTFSGTLNIKIKKYEGTHVNTKVENVYTNIESSGTIDLKEGKEYVIDFSKNDQLTEGLKCFAELDKTVYYKRTNNSLEKTENQEEAVIKIVGNRDENKAILTAVNVGEKISDNFQGIQTKYTGSKLAYDNTDYGDGTGVTINETRTDYYTKCSYNFIFEYANKENDNVEPGEKTPTEDENNTTITEPEKPSTPEKEEKPSVTEKDNTPKTGNTTNMVYLVSTSVIIFAVAVVIIKRKGE